METSNKEKLFDRLFVEVDSCSQKLEDVSKIVIESVTLLKILSRIVFVIVVAIISGSIALGYDSIKTQAEIKAIQKYHHSATEGKG